MATKKWYQSKTIWLNLIASLLAILPMLDLNFLTLIEVGNPTKYYAVVGFVTTVLNVALRFISDKPISNSKN